MIYRGYTISEKRTKWIVAFDGKEYFTFNKYEGDTYDGEGYCMAEIDRIKREERKEVDASIQRVDAQVKNKQKGTK